MRTRRARPRRKQKGGDVSLAEKGFFLGADIKHDFGETLSVPWYNLDGSGALVNRTSTEIEVYREFVRNRPDISGAEIRLNNSLRFTIPEQTGVYQSFTPPVLFGGGNASIGLVFDAGRNINNYLGTNNVITFGSVLDPACKPIDRSSKPIWYKPNSTRFTIDLSNFGFSPSIIRSMTVGNFQGNSISAVFSMSDGDYDAISRNIVRDVSSLAIKPINETDISRAGFFTSIAKARGEDDVKYYIGKTLGDMTLVASCMSNIGGVDNPYYGIQAGAIWRDLCGTPLAPQPSVQTLMLTTIDRLNHTRAFMEGVASIHQEIKTRACEFIPAVITAESIQTSLALGYAALIRESDVRYDALIESLTGAIHGDKLKPEFTNFTGTWVLTTQAELIAGKTYIDGIIATLREKKRVVKGWITARSTINPLTNENYNCDVEIINRVCPQTTNIRKGAEAEQRTKDIIVVIRIPRGGFPADAGFPEMESLHYELWSEFKRIRDEVNRIQEDADPTAGRKRRRSALVSDFIENVKSRPRSFTGGGQEYTSEQDKEDKWVLDGMPITTEFGKYVSEKMGMPNLSSISIGAGIYKEKDIADPLWDRFVNEIKLYMGGKNNIRELPEISTASLIILFYAFICATNSQNSRMSGLYKRSSDPQEEDSELVKYFTELEKGFIKNALQTQEDWATASLNTTSDGSVSGNTSQRSRTSSTDSQVSAPPPAPPPVAPPPVAPSPVAPPPVAPPPVAPPPPSPVAQPLTVVEDATLPSTLGDVAMDTGRDSGASSPMSTGEASGQATPTRTSDKSGTASKDSSSPSSPTASPPRSQVISQPPTPQTLLSQSRRGGRRTPRKKNLRRTRRKQKK